MDQHEITLEIHEISAACDQTTKMKIPTWATKPACCLQPALHGQHHNDDDVLGDQTSSFTVDLFIVSIPSAEQREAVYDIVRPLPSASALTLAACL
jgi:hypothetical protein